MLPSTSSLEVTEVNLVPVVSFAHLKPGTLLRWERNQRVQLLGENQFLMCG